jgi:hypothetical protein
MTLFHLGGFSYRYPPCFFAGNTFKKPQTCPLKWSNNPNPRGADLGLGILYTEADLNLILKPETQCKNWEFYKVRAITRGDLGLVKTQHETFYNALRYEYL